MESRIIAQAKKNYRDYRIIEKFTAGLVLTGNEIKSLRSHQASIGEAYVSPQQKELYVINMNIATYKYSYAGDLAKTDTRKKRKLLLKRREINKLIGTMKAKSYVLIPLQLFTNDKAICQAQYKEDVNLIKEFLGKAIAAFGNAQAYQVSRYIFPSEALLSEIEKQNQKSTPTKNANDDARFGYSTFQELKEGKHEIVRKYKELAAKIFDNYNDRKNRDFWDTSDSYISESYRKQCEQKNQIELRNRERLIKKMEQLIAKAEQEQGNNDKKRKREEVNNSSDTNKRSRSGKEEKDFGQLVSEKNRQKGEATNQKIDNILSVAREENDPQKLASLLEQIEKVNGGKDMAESKKNEIRELKERMFDSNPNQAKQEVISKLNNLLSQNNLSKEEHDKIAQELEDLNKEENKQAIIKKEESITEKIGIAGAQKRLNELVNKAKNFLQSNLLNKFQEVKKEVIQFIADKGYNHKAYLTNQSEIDQLFAQTSSEQRPQEPTWKKPETVLKIEYHSNKSDEYPPPHT
ncbi:523_t:CDS:2 [Entrophospora sp. SA101]|nr:523_t:CDS:2 [Entrophospora sp. SA101]